MDIIEKMEELRNVIGKLKELRVKNEVKNYKTLVDTSDIILGMILRAKNISSYNYNYLRCLYDDFKSEIVELEYKRNKLFKNNQMREFRDMTIALDKLLKNVSMLDRITENITKRAEENDKFLDSIDKRRR